MASLEGDGSRSRRPLVIAGPCRYPVAMNATGWAAALGLILAASGGCSDGPGDTDAGTDAGRDAAPMGDIGMDGDACVQGHDCDDGNPDTYGDEYTVTCECVGVPCESDACNVRAWNGRSCQVASINDGDPCDDGNDLTVRDRCSNAGACVGQTVPCTPGDGPCCDSSGVLLGESFRCESGAILGDECGDSMPRCGGDAVLRHVNGDRYCPGDAATCTGEIEEFLSTSETCADSTACFGDFGASSCMSCN